jgi:hypothetical protein
LPKKTKNAEKEIPSAIIEFWPTKFYGLDVSVHQGTISNQPRKKGLTINLLLNPVDSMAAAKKLGISGEQWILFPMHSQERGLPPHSNC